MRIGYSGLYKCLRAVPLGLYSSTKVEGTSKSWNTLYLHLHFVSNTTRNTIKWMQCLLIAYKVLNGTGSLYIREMLPPAKVKQEGL